MLAWRVHNAFPCFLLLAISFVHALAFPVFYFAVGILEP